MYTFTDRWRRARYHSLRAGFDLATFFVIELGFMERHSFKFNPIQSEKCGYPKKRCGISSKRLLKQRGISHRVRLAVIYERLAREKMSRDKKRTITPPDLLHVATPGNIREHLRRTPTGVCIRTPRCDGTSHLSKLRLCMHFGMLRQEFLHLRAVTDGVHANCLLLHHYVDIYIVCGMHPVELGRRTNCTMHLNLQ